ncbi:Hypothetical protein SMAX5B_016324 [Scophthalmus maximus]|uniref:Uncharacterized protein n=1 Tax=Scophthalmus maximus TaxID=52904 RepID=A0A2U9BLH7_SCOMX|nr:Hypothetical protein SMAX5B_016324 [Scophthalmus maximus]
MARQLSPPPPPHRSLPNQPASVQTVHVARVEAPVQGPVQGPGTARCTRPACPQPFVSADCGMQCSVNNDRGGVFAPRHVGLFVLEMV